VIGQNKKMVQNKIKQVKSGKVKKDSTFWMSIFILIIMVLSVLGFALSGSSGSKGSDNHPSEVPFQQFDNNGQVFWGAIKNNEQFIFDDIAGFDEDNATAALANRIKSQNNVEIYIDGNFSSNEALYLIEKSFRALKIKYNKTKDKKCDSNTIVLTNNDTLKGDCIKFVSTNEEAFNKANVLTYYLIK